MSQLGDVIIVLLLLTLELLIQPLKPFLIRPLRNDLSVGLWQGSSNMSAGE